MVLPAVGVVPAIDNGRPLAYNSAWSSSGTTPRATLCFADRGFDFAYAVHAFLDNDRIVTADRRWDYGEDRYRLLGVVEGRVFVAIYTMRDSTIRIVSARKANRREVREYEQNTVDN